MFKSYVLCQDVDILAVCLSTLLHLDRTELTNCLRFKISRYDYECNLFINLSINSMIYL